MTHIMKNMKEIEDYKKEHGDDDPNCPEPDYKGAISISTTASLKYMIAPGLLVIGVPLIAGLLFGPYAVEGILAGAIVSGVQVAISASNTGGAWDNAKKETEKQRGIFYSYAKENWDGFEKDKAWIKAKIAEWNALSDEERDGMDEKERNFQLCLSAFKEQHTAAVVGDTVGDPLKDTSGPAINILIKLSAITSLVFASYIKNFNLRKYFSGQSA